jgi:uncharacterized protein
MIDIELVSSLKSCLSNILPRYPVNLAYLFGSAATGQTTPLSDVDVALVLTTETITPGKQLALELKIAEEISRQCAIADVDVRMINTAPLMLRGEVVTQGILLYCTDELFRIEFETSTRSDYFDFLPIAAQIQQGYLDRLYERGLNG